MAGVRRTTRASGSDELVVEFRQVRPAEGSGLRAGTSGLSAEELVELGMRSILFGEPLPDQFAMLGLAETGIDIDDLRRAFDQPNEIAEGITRLVIADGLVGSGRARRLISLNVGPRSGDVRRVVIEREDPRVHTNVEPARRRLEGEWRRR